MLLINWITILRTKICWINKSVIDCVNAFIPSHLLHLVFSYKFFFLFPCLGLLFPKDRLYWCVVHEDTFRGELKTLKEKLFGNFFPLLRKNLKWIFVVVVAVAVDIYRLKGSSNIFVYVDLITFQILFSLFTLSHFSLE